MAIENTEKELSQIYQELDNNWLVLPNFQRQFVWSKDKQKKLLASVLVGLPTGSLLVLHGETNDFSKRALCFPNEVNTTESKCDYLLDGQQRLTTLRSIFYDVFGETEWLHNWNNLYGSLRNRWFIRVQPDKSEQDIFGWENLKFESIKDKTDTDIEDFIIHKPVLKGKTKEIYHPAYDAVDSDSQTITDPIEKYNILAEEFATVGLVPLWWIGRKLEEIPRGVKKLHKNVLERIAEKRTRALQDIIYSKIDREEILYQLFQEDGVTRKIIKKEIEDQTNKSDGSLSVNTFSQQWANLRARWVESISNELESCVAKKISIIYLTRDETHRAVAIFEALNRGGEPLSTYDLIVAKSARDNKISNLTSRILEELNKSIDISNLTTDTIACWNASCMKIANDNEPTKTFKDWFVAILSLLAFSEPNHKSECKIELIKKAKILSLTKDDVNQKSILAITAISRALAFLQFRCGVTDSNNISYKLMVVVLAYHLSNNDIWANKRSLNKIEYWYWTAIFSGFYSNRQNEQCIDDINDLNTLLYEEKNPFLRKQEDRLFNVQDYLTKEMLLREDDNEGESKAVKIAILQFILSKKPFDFSEKHNRLTAWNVSNGDQELELHHIIPLKHATKIGQSSSELRKDPNHILNSCLNYIFISKSANRYLRDYSPSDYLSLLSRFSHASSYMPDINNIREDLEHENYRNILNSRYELIKSAIYSHLSTLAN